MHKKTVPVWLLWAIGAVTLAQTPAKKAIYIIMDGIPTDIIHRACTPNLDRIEKEGAFLHSYVGGERGGYTQTPTISANGYATLVTGTWANKNNVWDNSLDNPNYHYPTLFKLYKDARPEGKTGIYSTWSDNRSKLLGEGLPATGNIRFDYVFDGLDTDTEHYPHDRHSNHIKRIDAEVALEAAKSIYSNGPDLSWVYLQYTDDVGHHHGDSPEFYNSITFQDALVGLIYDAVKQREEELGEEWLFIVVTDHGRTPVTARDHGGQSDNERHTWMVINKKEINRYALNHRTAAVDLLPTVCDYLEIEIPATTRYELDGVSVLKEVDAIDLKGSADESNRVTLTWTAIHPEDDTQAEILVSYTDSVRDGGKDSYLKAGKVNVKDGKATLPVRYTKNTDFMKVVLKTPNNTLNCHIRKL
jgi:arylsulfatase A-like enzyme